MGPAEKCLSDSRFDGGSTTEALHSWWSCFRHTHGSHFANELEERDYVIGEMWKNKPPFGLAMNKTMSDDVAWHCKHYTGRGVRTFMSLAQPWPWI